MEDDSKQVQRIDSPPVSKTPPLSAPESDLKTVSPDSAISISERVARLEATYQYLATREDVIEIKFELRVYRWFATIIVGGAAIATTILVRFFFPETPPA